MPESFFFVDWRDGVMAAHPSLAAASGKMQLVAWQQQA